MFLYLTSLASRTLPKLIPYLSKKPDQMTVAFIPTAADKYLEKPWVDDDRNKLIELGFKVTDCDIKKFTKKELQIKLKDVDIIFVTGGTTTYLLDIARKSGFFDLAKDLVNNGKIYIGGSAGAVFAGPNIEIDDVFESRGFGVKLDDYTGLNLIDFVPVPHADNKKYTDVIKEIDKRFSKKFTLKKLNDNEALLVHDGKVTKITPG